MDLFQVGQILGFKPGEVIDAASVKAKIREKSRENHPDTLQGAGASEAEIKQRRSVFETVKETGDRLVDALNGTGKVYTMPGASKWQQDLADVLREKDAQKQQKKQENRSEEDRRKYEAAQAEIRRNKEEYARQRNGGYQNNDNGYNSTRNNGGGERRNGTNGSSGYTGGSGFNGNGNGQSNGNTNGRSKESEAERKRREEERIVREFNRAQEEARRAKEQADKAREGAEKMRAEQAAREAADRAEDILFEWDYFKGGWGSVSEEEAQKRGSTFFENWRRSREHFSQERQRKREERRRYHHQSEAKFNKKMEDEFGEFWQQYMNNQAEGAEFAEKIRRVYEWRKNNPHAEDDQDRKERRERDEAAEEFAKGMEDARDAEERRKAMAKENIRSLLNIGGLGFVVMIFITLLVKNRETIGLGKSEKDYIRMEEEQIKKEKEEAALKIEIEKARAREAEENARKMKFVAELDTIQSYIIAIQKEKNYFTPLTESNPIFEGTYGRFQSGGIGVVTDRNGRQYDCSFALYKKVDEKTKEARIYFVLVEGNKKTVIEERRSKELYHLGPVEYQFTFKDIKRLKEAFAHTYYGR